MSHFNYESLIETFNMFLFLSVELTLLFLAISYLVGVIQFYVPPAKIQRILSDKNGKGYFVAAALGAITPFCSCSTIPFLKGLIRAQAGFGTMMVFLFSSPLLNPIIIGLFAVTFGLEVTVFYFVFALGVSILAGFILERLGFADQIKQEAYIEPVKSTSCGSSCKPKETNKWKVIWQSTWQDFKKVLPYLMLGITIGSFIYGFMPEDTVARFANDDNPFAILIAAVIGIPLYIRAEAVIPLSAALVAKGMGLGAVMALIIGSAGASLTEIILLKSIFKNKLVIAFVAVILTMAVGAGLTYSWLF